MVVGTSARITIVTGIDAAATTIVRNLALVSGDQSDPDESNNEVELITSVNQEGSLPLTMSDDPDPVKAGTNLTYTLHISSAGPSDATNVVLIDTLPAEVTDISIDYDDTLGVCGYASGAVTCLFPDMEVGTDTSVVIRTKVDPSASGQINNTASVSADGAIPSQTNENTTVEGSADLALISSAAPSTVVAGKSLTVTLDVTNNGPSVAKQAFVNSTLPAGTTFAGGPGCSQLGATIICDLGDLPVGAQVQPYFVLGVATGTTGEISSFSSAFSTTPDPDLGNNSSEATAQAIAESDLELSKQASAAEVLAGQSVTYTIVPLDASAVVTVAVRILPSTTGLIINDATVTSDSFDLDETNDSDAVPITVNTLANLNVGKIAVTDPITAGARLSYLITVGNAGPSDARNVILVDTLPAGLTPVSATPTEGGPCDLSGPITCPLGAIAPGQIISVTLIVDVSSAQIEGLANSVNVGSDTAESDQTDNSATENTAVTTVADLVLEFVGAPDPVIAGDLLTYTLTITNDGPSDATSVLVTTTLPAEVQLLEILPASALCTGATDIVCEFGSMSAGSTTTVTFATKVEPEIETTIVSTATVSSEQTDPATENGSVTESTVILQNFYIVRLPLVRSALGSDEPNDGCDQAFRILTNYDYSFMPNDSPDWYTFNLTSDGIMTVKLTNFTPLLGQIAVFAGADCGNRDLLGHVGNPGLTETLNLGLQGPGKYYIFVGSDGPLSTTNPYGLRVSVEAPPG
jgi:uncharacterized repeat protein (TIGR01451 family)